MPYIIRHYKRLFVQAWAVGNSKVGHLQGSPLGVLLNCESLLNGICGHGTYLSPGKVFFSVMAFYILSTLVR